MSNYSYNSNRSSTTNINREICVDNLFPSENKSGTRGRKLDIESIFSGTLLNNEPDITFTSDILIERIKKRRLEKLKHYKNMLKYCHDRILATSEDLGTDVIFTVVDIVPECKEYDPRECIDYISAKLREDDFDTIILTDTTMFVTWRYLELKKEDRNKENKENNETNENGENNANSGTNENIEH